MLLQEEAHHALVQGAIAGLGRHGSRGARQRVVLSARYQPPPDLAGPCVGDVLAVVCATMPMWSPQVLSLTRSLVSSPDRWLELGLSAAGHNTSMLCEIWDSARAVLSTRFPDVTLENDVCTLRELPDDVELVTAAFPCTDLSQAGRTAGIQGEQSGLVVHVFRLLDQHHPRWLVLENVRNMLPLDSGRAMRYLVSELERASTTGPIEWSIQGSLGFPREGREYFSLLARLMTLRTVLLSDDAGEAGPEHYAQDAFGFYWTEGLRGLGWARDATPTLKGGSTIGIPSPPGIWIPGAPLGRQLVTPSVEDAEELQGFARGWTSSACDARGRKGPRWKLVGNAVTVGVAEWLGRRLACPGSYDGSDAVRMSGRRSVAFCCMGHCRKDDGALNSPCGRSGVRTSI